VSALIRRYLAAWYAVNKDVKSQTVIEVSVPEEMPDEAPRTVEQALLMHDLLSLRCRSLTKRIMRTLTKRRRTPERQEELLEQTRRLLKWINIRRGYLNKAANLRLLEDRLPEAKITDREVLLYTENQQAVRVLEGLKAMSTEREDEE
jgi:hypothetical protein